MQSLRVTDYPARGAMAPHSHDDPSLIVVVRGTYLDSIRGVEVEHRAGRMIWYPAHAVHSQRFGASGARKIVFTPPQSSMQYLADHGISLDSARHVDAAAITHLVQRAVAETRNDDPFTPLVVEGLALELVAAFARADSPSKRATAPAWLRMAREAICDAPDETLSLDAIAAQAGRHPVHLAREFRRYFGTTVGAYRRFLRLQRAEAMLRRKIGLTEIALACGFASHSHFCRAFKTAYGVTPSRFRGRA